MVRQPPSWRPTAALIVTVAGVLVAAAVAAETGTVVPTPMPDPLRSPVAPYRGPAFGHKAGPSDEQQLYNYRTDLRSRQRELDQARPADTPRLMEERRELRQELDRVRRLSR